jgi:hypothetical protein
MTTTMISNSEPRFGKLWRSICLVLAEITVSGLLVMGGMQWIFSSGVRTATYSHRHFVHPKRGPQPKRFYLSDAQHQLYKTNTKILIIALPLTLIVLFAGMFYEEFVKEEPEAEQA